MYGLSDALIRIKAIGMSSSHRSPPEFVKSFCGRIKALRLATGLRSIDMALLLGQHIDRYRAYERSVLMPLNLLALFADAVGCSLDDLLRDHPGMAEINPAVLVDPYQAWRAAYETRKRERLPRVRLVAEAPDPDDKWEIAYEARKDKR